jgi:hypothetical protein
VPAKTPREIVDKLAQETQKALAAPGVRETRAARHGPDADHARCLRCADQARDRFNSRLGQSGEPRVQLTSIGRVIHIPAIARLPLSLEPLVIGLGPHDHHGLRTDGHSDKAG